MNPASAPGGIAAAPERRDYPVDICTSARYYPYVLICQKCVGRVRCTLTCGPGLGGGEPLWAGGAPGRGLPRM